MDSNTHTLFTDGGARGNPGPAAYGFVLKDATGTVVAKEGKCIGEGTNNFAEYEALIAGLRKAKSLKVRSLQCYLDSELVVKQLLGAYKVKDENIKAAFMTIWNLRVEIGDVRFEHIPREKNAEADALVNQALDEQERKPQLGL